MYLLSNIIKVDCNVDHLLPVLVSIKCVYGKTDHLLNEEQPHSIAVIQ